MKQYHYLAGLPRSGNTLLSALINQHPDIYCGPISPMIDHLWSLRSNLDIEPVIVSGEQEKTKKLIRNLFDLYYDDIEKPVVVDIQKNWSTPFNVEMIKEYINPNPKIIYTTRDILEVLLSFINIMGDSLLIEMLSSDWQYRNYLTKLDNMCDYLMSTNRAIDVHLSSINAITNENNKGIFCVVDYNEMIKRPQETMSRVYSFLGLEDFKNDFSNISMIAKHNDENANLPKDLHNIRPELGKTSQDPREVFSDYVISKYSNMGYNITQS